MILLLLLLLLPLEILISVAESTLTWATCKVNFRIHSVQWVSNLTDTQILQVCEGTFPLTQPLSKRSVIR